MKYGAEATARVVKKIQPDYGLPDEWNQWMTRRYRLDAIVYGMTDEELKRWWSMTPQEKGEWCNEFC